MMQPFDLLSCASHRPGSKASQRVVAASLLACGATVFLHSIAARSQTRLITAHLHHDVVSSSQLTAHSPREWVVDASNNEIKALTHSGSYLRYRVHTVDHRGDRVRDAIETTDGSVARLVLKDGRPLTPDEDKEERDRLAGLLATPADFAKHTKEDTEGKKLAADLIRMLPDAMTYSYTPGQPQTSGASAPEVVLDYAPKPGWNPPTTVSEGLRGLRGRVWIDARTHYVVRMEGDIFQSVNLGWGMLAHIYPGGKLLLEQRSVKLGAGPSDERWIYTHFADDLKVRAVLIKTLTVHTEIDSSDYQPLATPPTYQDAIRALLATPLPH